MTGTAVVCTSALLLLFVSVIVGQAPAGEYVNFEGAQTNPIRLSADGTRLFAVNTPDARLSVFDVSAPSSPALLAEIPVGIEPVSVNPRTSDEVWVVNQVSDSVSIVSVSRRIVIDTIRVKDEPADVVFAGANRAFVSVSRSNEVHVFDAVSHELIRKIPVFGGNPRALAVSPDLTKVYVAFAASGNRTTIVGRYQAPAQPPPTNPALPLPPRVGLIVDAGDPTWQPVVHVSMPDNDVATIDAGTLEVARYYSGVGTLNLGLAVQPATGDLYVANTDARNRVAFEPNLRGHWVDNRITRVVPGSGAVTAFDLNPDIDYSILPNPAALSTALAQPTAIVFDPTMPFMFVAAFGTDRVAKVSVDGSVLSFVEVGSAASSSVDPRTKRGPRGLALQPLAPWLYVLNRISNTISVLDTESDGVAVEIPVGSFDPTPAEISNGRGFLYDAKLSGNGTGSCASCHLDSEMDKLAWNLGDPGGEMQTIDFFGHALPLHPMKGPMTTRTLRGLPGLQPYQWRGEKADFQAFGALFDTLMGGASLSGADIAAYTDFVNTIRFQPNPHQNLDRTLPASVRGGDPTAGLNAFLNFNLLNRGSVTCNQCHTANPGPGTNNIVGPFPPFRQPFKIAHLMNVYQKLDFNQTPGGPSIDGFGLLNDGSGSSVQSLAAQNFPKIATMPQLLDDLAAFLLCFDTGMPPAVGYSRTATPQNVLDPSIQEDWAMLRNQAAVGNVDLIVKGTIDGEVHGLLYRPPSGDYQSDKSGLGPFTPAELSVLISAGDTLTATGVPVGSGIRMGVDRDLDGSLDGDE